MRKLILFITLIVAIGVNVNAQWNLQKDTDYNYYESGDNYVLYYIGTSDDVMDATDSTITKTVLLNSDEPLMYEIEVGLDSAGVSDSVMTYLQNKTFYTDDWTDTDSTKWYMSSADTSFKFTETSTGLSDRYWRIYIKGYSAVTFTELDFLNFRWYK